VVLDDPSDRRDAVTTAIPADQEMLLRLIDSKFETSNAKLDGISATLQVMTDRFDHYDDRFSDHEKRIADIEGQMTARKVLVADYDAHKLLVATHGSDIVALQKWQTEEQTTNRNASRWGGYIWGACGSAVTAIIGWIIVSYVNATASPPVQPVRQIEHVQTATISR
jgi:hypothetical protein